MKFYECAYKIFNLLSVLTSRGEIFSDRFRLYFPPELLEPLDLVGDDLGLMMAVGPDAAKVRGFKRLFYCQRPKSSPIQPIQADSFGEAQCAAALWGLLQGRYEQIV